MGRGEVFMACGEVFSPRGEEITGRGEVVAAWRTAAPALAAYSQ